MIKAVLLLLAVLILGRSTVYASEDEASGFTLTDNIGCYWIYSENELTADANNDLFDGLRSLTGSTEGTRAYLLAPMGKETKNGKECFRYYLDLENKDTKLNSDVYAFLSSVENVLIECDVRMKYNGYYCSPIDIGVVSKYQITDIELVNMLSGLDEHSIVLEYENEDDGTYKYIVTLKKRESYFEAFAYLSSCEELRVSALKVYYLASSPQSNSPLPAKGDVDGSNSIDAHDAMLILKYDVGLLQYAPSLQLADVNCDGKMNAVDAAKILQYDVGILSEF